MITEKNELSDDAENNTAVASAGCNKMMMIMMMKQITNLQAERG